MVKLISIIILFFATLASTKGSNNPKCIDAKDDDGLLCSVKISEHTFQPPNSLVPEAVRGVYWIDAGGDAPGYSNPWVDLNYLQAFPSGSSKEGKLWVMDRTPGYQSWEDVPESYPYIAQLTKIGSRSEVDPRDLTVTWSACGFTCGTRYEVWVPMPVTSPSQKVGPNEYVRQAKVFGVTVSEWKGYRVIDDKGERTEFWDRLVGQVGDVVVMIDDAE